MTSSLPCVRPEIRNRAAHETDRDRLRILVVHDEQWSDSNLGALLHSAGYDIYPAPTGEEALRIFPLARPDLILLELGLPDMDGKQVLLRLRELTTVPVIVISVRNQEEEKIACLDYGADDYITKPFATGELLARLRAALRRAFGIPRGEVFTAGFLKVDFVRREVQAGSHPIKLTATEYGLLKVLAIHAGSVRTHRQLIREVWGATQYHDPVHLLRVTVSNLRRKLSPDRGSRCPIATEAGVGYRLLTASGATNPRTRAVC